MVRLRPGVPPAGTGAHAARPDGGRQRTGYGGATRRRLDHRTKDGSVTVGPPKSAAGLRTVALSEIVISGLRTYLDRYADDHGEAFVFLGAKGAMLRRSTFTRIWSRALKDAGLSGVHFHDLRHAGNTFASRSGATLREPMNRMGHSTTRAALIYLHTESERDRKIADGMGRLAEEALKNEDQQGSDT
ncbi:tyrosine-type recombinase/integrase [Streptosporangium sandarakinum]